ncbi:MAG: type VI secretion system baseplate subunit TssK [Bacteroidales bacterium]|nr:type VI secretion system baseplate subunit TssK [Candidatus Physcousia equi]
MKRISWKKGMRLTEDIFRLSDTCAIEQINTAMALAACGRFGLFPQRTFDIALQLNATGIDVVSLDCCAVTRDGSLIDVCYDSNYSNTFSTRADIPQTSSMGRLLVTIAQTEDAWCDTNDGFAQPVYAYNIIDENTPLPINAMPVARLVNNGGAWTTDEEFVPPCLFVSSHQRFIELAMKAKNLLAELNSLAQQKAKSAGRQVLRTFWPVLQQSLIDIDKQLVTLTPMQLLGTIQKTVGAFAMGFDFDDEFELGNAATYREFTTTPYNYKEALPLIRKGVGLLGEMQEKIAQFGEAAPKPAPVETPKPEPPKRNRWSGMSI